MTHYRQHQQECRVPNAECRQRPTINTIILCQFTWESSLVVPSTRSASAMKCLGLERPVAFGSLKWLLLFLHRLRIWKAIQHTHNANAEYTLHRARAFVGIGPGRIVSECTNCNQYMRCMLQTIIFHSQRNPFSGMEFVWVRNFCQSLYRSWNGYYDSTSHVVHQFSHKFRGQMLLGEWGKTGTFCGNSTNENDFVFNYSWNVIFTHNACPLPRLQGKVQHFSIILQYSLVSDFPSTDSRNKVVAPK